MCANVCNGICVYMYVFQLFLFYNMSLQRFLIFQVASSGMSRFSSIFSCSKFLILGKTRQTPSSRLSPPAYHLLRISFSCPGISFWNLMTTVASPPPTRDLWIPMMPSCPNLRTFCHPISSFWLCLSTQPTFADCLPLNPLFCSD